MSHSNSAYLNLYIYSNVIPKPWKGNSNVNTSRKKPPNENLPAFHDVERKKLLAVDFGSLIRIMVRGLFSILKSSMI